MRLALSILLLSRVAAADPEKLAGNVLVWHDAHFFVQPSEKAPSVTLATLDGARTAHPGAVVPMTVLSTTGGFVQVTPAGQDCTWSRFDAGQLEKLVLFVRRADLAPVITKAYTVRGHDGTIATLGVGTPVVLVSGTRFVVPLDRQALAIELPDAPIGLAYRPEAPGQSPNLASRLAVETVATVAGAKLTIVDAGWRPTALVTKGTTTLFSTQRSCVALTLAVPTIAVTPIAGGDAVAFADLLSGDGAHPAYDYVPRGTPLSAGTTTVAIARSDITVTKSGPLACFDAPLAFTHWETESPPLTSTQAILRLCAPASAAKHAEAETRRRPHNDLGQQLEDVKKKQ